MSWKSMIEVQDAGIKLPDDPHLPVMDGGIEQIAPDPYSDRWIYRMVIRLHSQFHANRAELPRATKIAERALAETLFADVRSRLDRLRSAVYNRDYDTAFKLIDEIDAATKPE